MTLPKHLSKGLDGRKYPLLVVQKQKHVTNYYLAHDRDELMRVFVAMLRNNQKAQYYYKPDKPVLKDALTAEQIAALPERLQESERRRLDDNRRAMAEYEHDLENWNNIQKAIKDSDGEAAYQVLHDRRDAEYEGWDFETLEKI